MFKKVFFSLVLLVTLTYSGGTMAESQHQAKPKVIVFDVNETLLDLEQMQSSVAKALDGNTQLLPLWFSTMLHHSLVSTVSNDYCLLYTSPSPRD